MKLSKNLVLSILIFETEGISVLISQEQTALPVSYIYFVKSQFSSHNVLLFLIKSFFLSDKDISVPLSEVEV